MTTRARVFPMAVATMVVVLAAGACATAHPTVAKLGSSPVPVFASPTTSVRPTPTGPPHFATPEAAMRYLAAAWNRGDLVSLKHVTDPAARDQLNAMHSEAINLRLKKCTARPQGDYVCTFAHDYPPGYHPAPGSTPEAGFLVGPALTPGWYMTVFEYCG